MTGASFIYENRGTVNVPAFYDAGTLPLSVAYNYAPTFGDLSGRWSRRYDRGLLAGGVGLLSEVRRGA